MRENTKTEDGKPKTEKRIFWVLFALAVIFIYFFGLTVPLLGPDEPRYSQVAREMFLRGDWTTPTLGGFDWFEKPALLYWLQIASYNLFGVSEFAARFGSALFGLGTIFALWILGKSLNSENPKSEIQNRNNFSNWFALVAASSIGLIVFSRGASFDIILTFPITAAMVAFFIFDQSKGKTAFVRNFPLLVFYFFVGVALIAKGLVGVVFPFAIVAFYYVLSRKTPSKIFVFSLVWGTILSLIVASAWYFPMYRANGWKFIDEFFIQHHFQRYTSNKYQHPQPFWFFFVVLPLMTIPWLPFFLASIWNYLKGFFSDGTTEQNDKNSEFEIQNVQLKNFAFAWMLVPLVFFSLSGSKLPGYILPALPAALVLTAEYVNRFVQKSDSRKLFVKSIALATFLVIAVIIQFVLPGFANRDSVKILVEAANANGYETEKIVNLYTISHNLEFYGAGRIVRAEDGKQKRYDDFSVLAADAKREWNGQILALVPEKDVPDLLRETNLADITVLNQNGEHAIVLIKAK